MASALIHIAVASEINKKLNFDKSKLLLGTIAPDISQAIGENKLQSHFQDNLDDIPSIDKFLVKYKNKLNDAFVMGYFIHLYTDYLWFKYFIPELYSKNMITKLDGTTVKCNENLAYLCIYNDYSNLNIKIIDEYNLDLKIFYNEFPKLDNIITEIPIDKLNMLKNKLSIIIKNTKERKEYSFNMHNINKFIDMCTKLILSRIMELI